MTQKNIVETEHIALAKGLDLSISTKQSVEISSTLRYMNTTDAKNLLEGVINLRKAIPFRRFNRDTGHKRGMSAGRFPQKAAKEFLRLIKSVEANAQAKGLDTANLKITKLVANKAAIPVTGGRLRHQTKRTHLEIMVQEKAGLKKSKGKDASSKETKKPSSESAGSSGEKVKVSEIKASIKKKSVTAKQEKQSDSKETQTTQEESQ